MTKMLYVELLGEERRPDPKSPTGYARVMAGNGKCAVFDEEELDSLIQKTKSRLQSLKSLRKTAEAHSSIMAEEYLKALDVPYKVHTLNKKNVESGETKMTHSPYNPLGHKSNCKCPQCKLRREWERETQ